MVDGNMLRWLQWWIAAVLRAASLKCKLGYQGELVKEKDEENERLCGIITGLLAEKEKDNVDKHTMLNRMSQIEALLTAIVLR
ncbi:hypothetical protein HanHA300_Chr04g0125881 [Helianthus annuus]|nr:hypothetical protein HanHA300_Chr04g0125881 [Helianthus annuus]KAJ0596076.1 hypothetical protein HanHA89_Chr04g0138681 [Helianthus annuus]KAJ0756726.1 hypothetical protein HanLR1_Chr04g0130421 [Helianthus annuus]